MSRYTRAFTPGGTFFFTVNLADRSQSLLTENIDELRASLRRVRERHPFHIDAIVILPDHLHSVWTLPPGDTNYPTRWALIKAGFSRTLPRDERIASSRIAKGERGIWQRRYWEHQIRNEDDYARHVDYIHYNPVKHGYAKSPKDWPHSSLHRYIRNGILPADWGTSYAKDSHVGWGELANPNKP
ncbi:MAG: transposase [Sulfurimicrobium sp.]|nr:transposase [Sulfurimicrobium sp.]MDP1706152.1 transposase [Sulfurimicrobium sp.]MDP2198210.1 transposase [Sulfurimicrobium sp.]MDP3686021.1 transposase [Sulfurimicrobium sp.]MDZ7656035.1 transposase [Sulfurimicrobium sp.]